MRIRCLGFGQYCFLMVVFLLACGSPVTSLTEAIPTPMPLAIEETLLHRIAEEVCPYPDNPDKLDPYLRYFTTKDPAYSFICWPAAGHSITVTLRRFADPSQAKAEFRLAHEGGSVKEVRGNMVSDWQEQHPSFPGGRYEYRVRQLQVDRWLISIRSFDDTHFLIAPDPQEASKAVLRVVRDYGLSPALDEPR